MCDYCEKEKPIFEIPITDRTCWGWGGDVKISLNEAEEYTHIIFIDRGRPVRPDETRGMAGACRRKEPDNASKHPCRKWGICAKKDGKSIIKARQKK